MILSEVNISSVFVRIFGTEGWGIEPSRVHGRGLLRLPASPGATPLRVMRNGQAGKFRPARRFLRFEILVSTPVGKRRNTGYLQNGFL